jgi:hypothetical protein
MQVSVMVAGWACRSSAGCWGTLRRRPRRAISITIHCGVRRKLSRGELQRSSTEDDRCCDRVAEHTNCMSLAVYRRSPDLGF